MITLYHAPQSRSSRMIWLLEELGAPYTIEPVDIARPMNGTGSADPRNPHPDKQVPAIDDDGVLIVESVAIALYLSDAYPAAGLAPALGDRSRGPYLSWMAWYAAALEPALFAQMGGELASSPMKQRSYDAVVRRLETVLTRQSHLMGDPFSAADLLVGSALGWARAALPESPAIDAYVARCQARPAAQRGMAKDDASGLQRAA